MKRSARRTGIRIRGGRGHPEVRGAIIRFARWLRLEYEFPIRVPVYLFPSESIVTMHGEIVTASFFAPNSRAVEPLIRLATGDYPRLRRERGRDDALAAILHSLAHEVVHYQQWLRRRAITERGTAASARKIVQRYATVTDRP